MKLAYVDYWPPGLTTAGQWPASCHRRSASADLPSRRAASGNGTRLSLRAGLGSRCLTDVVATVMPAVPRGNRR
jgi:hypothetical protein